jgi:hypothetical protein
MRPPQHLRAPRQTAPARWSARSHATAQRAAAATQGAAATAPSRPRYNFKRKEHTARPAPSPPSRAPVGHRHQLLGEPLVVALGDADVAEVDLVLLVGIKACGRGALAARGHAGRTNPCRIRQQEMARRCGGLPGGGRPPAQPQSLGCALAMRPSSAMAAGSREQSKVPDRQPSVQACLSGALPPPFPQGTPHPRRQR